MLVGCNPLAPLAYYLRPPQIQKPEFEFPADSRVLLLVETARPEQANPVFEHALQEQCSTLLKEGGCKATLLPRSALAELRMANADFSSWSLQRIGRELGADYVLYFRLEQLQVREAPDHPVLSPVAVGRCRVVGVRQPAADARVWPDSAEGHEVRCTRQTSQADEPDAVDSESAQLGHDTAYWLTMPFTTVDLERSPPVQR